MYSDIVESTTITYKKNYILYEYYTKIEAKTHKNVFSAAFTQAYAPEPVQTKNKNYFNGPKVKLHCYSS